METRRLHPEWLDSHAGTTFPFMDSATLRNEDGIFLPEDAFLDATLYPVGGEVRMRLSKVVVTNENVTVYVGDEDVEELASGMFDILSPPSSIRLTDSYERPAGLLISEPDRLAIFQAWSVGTHLFSQEQMGFAAVCCVPTPAISLRGFLLADGSLMTGDVWMLGDDGVVLTPDVQPGRLLDVNLTYPLTHSAVDDIVKWHFAIQITELPDVDFGTPIIDRETGDVYTPIEWSAKYFGETSYSAYPKLGLETQLSVHGVDAASVRYKLRATDQDLIIPGKTYRVRYRQKEVGGEWLDWTETTISYPLADCMGRSLAAKNVLRVDVVGDPLFRRRICEGVFETPHLLRMLTVRKDCADIICGPDNTGDFKLTVGSQDASDTILRIRSTSHGLVIEAVGETLEGRQ